MMQMIVIIALFSIVLTPLACVIWSQVYETRRHKRLISFLGFIEGYASSSNQGLDAKALQKKGRLLLQLNQVADELLNNNYPIKQMDATISTMIEKTKD